MVLYSFDMFLLKEKRIKNIYGHDPLMGGGGSNVKPREWKGQSNS